MQLNSLSQAISSQTVIQVLHPSAETVRVHKDEKVAIARPISHTACVQCDAGACKHHRKGWSGRCGPLQHLKNSLLQLIPSKPMKNNPLRLYRRMVSLHVIVFTDVSIMRDIFLAYDVWNLVGKKLSYDEKYDSLKKSLFLVLHTNFHL